MAARVLVIDDEADIARLLVHTLEREGYAVSWTGTGEGGLDHVADAPPDLVILDLGLPDLDGLEVCRRARDDGYDGGILILTARGQELDRVVGLDVGADDYLGKPFGLAELHARVRALLRRTSRRPAPSSTPEGTSPAGLRVDPAARRVYTGGYELKLSSKEFDVLALLAREPGIVVSRETLIAEVWGRELVRLDQDPRRHRRPAAPEARRRRRRGARRGRAGRRLPARDLTGC